MITFNVMDDRREGSGGRSTATARDSLTIPKIPEPMGIRQKEGGGYRRGKRLVGTPHAQFQLGPAGHSDFKLDGTQYLKELTSHRICHSSCRNSVHTAVSTAITRDTKGYETCPRTCRGRPPAITGNKNSESADNLYFRNSGGGFVHMHSRKIQTPTFADHRMDPVSPIRFVYSSTATA